MHSIDSGPRWRLYRNDTPAGAVYIALPLTDLDPTIDTLITREIWIGSALLATGAIAAYLLAGGALRPLHTIDTVASAIVTGETDHRVDTGSLITEILRLASSINVMLDRIHRSARAERTAKDTPVRSQENLRRFVADASHELRTPLTSIKEFSELHRLDACAETGALMGRIESEADRMSRLVDDLLLLARLDSQPHLDNRPVEVLALLADCLNSAKTLAPHRPINLHIATGAETVQVLGDATRLTQVVMNLLTNAIRHTPPQTSTARAAIFAWIQALQLDPAALDPRVSAAGRVRKTVPSHPIHQRSRSRAIMCLVNGDQASQLCFSINHVAVPTTAESGRGTVRSSARSALLPIRVRIT